jgi:proteasome lid subunit RPN8/RPN11
MDLDIQFGELEEAQPEAQLRPDRNKHFAVVAYDAPAAGDLPIFVDLDVMRDIEAHAATDTSVELGGVLLGGQFQDADGRPFVVVTDSLRAQHFEATKGSFKFTHDTWERISRERDEFPENLQMVGWYHTHPDWGVFLSSMDMFICDNFFNRPLDLALVVDPCRGDRGMFQWTGESRERIRRTGGFYLIASRHRCQELELFAAQLEGKLTMPTTDPRFGSYPIHMSTPAPVVNIAESRNPWQGPVMAGMLTVQLLIVVLLAWKLLDPLPGFTAAEAEPEKKEPTVAERIQTLQQEVERRFNDQELLSAQREAQREILQTLVNQMNDANAPTLVQKLEAQKLESAQLNANLQGQQALVRELKVANKVLSDDLKSANGEVAAKNSQIERLEADAEELKSKKTDAEAKVSKLTEEKTDLQQQVAGKAISWPQIMFWVYLGLAALAGGAAGAATVVVVRRNLEAETEEDAYEQESIDSPGGATHSAATDGDAANSGDGRPAEPATGEPGPRAE